MIRIRMFRGLLVSLVALMLSATAQAQLFRAYLSASGSDSNPCTLISPCRLLPAALNAVVSGGEIWIIDSANYNLATVSIGKSVSILAVPGAVGSVVAIGGPAIAIGASGLSVALRNLVIVPFTGGGGTDGVYMTGASTLLIEKSLIANLPSYGVHLEGFGKVKIANTIIRNTGGWAVSLVNGATGEIADSQMLANAFGGVSSNSSIAATSTASVSDSIISGPGTAGVWAITTVAGAVAQVFVTRCTIEGAINAGLMSQTLGTGSAVVAVSNSVVVNNNSAWFQSGTGSVLRTLGNNHITDNTNPPTGGLTSTLPM